MGFGNSEELLSGEGYELRHTAVTLQAEAGHSAWAIADWAGTSERMIADVYRHKLMDASPLDPAI